MVSMDKTQPVRMAALFDLDGVVIDTEPQYSRFWKSVGDEFLPGVEAFEQKIKGQTLMQIYGKWFPGNLEFQSVITERLNAFEAQMAFPWIPGVRDFLSQLRENGIFTAVVTSSNREKMASVYAKVPELRMLFDRILTSEDFARSKPDPDCYLRGAAVAGADVRHCVVFEDSLHGLQAGNSAGMVVVGLSTTNPAERIAPLCRCVIPDFRAITVEKMRGLLP